MDKFTEYKNNPIKIIKKPIITSKSKLKNKYSFNVALSTNKTIIKQSIEYLFNVKVTKVNTQIILKKNIKLRKCYKKATVTIKNKNRIKLFIKH